MKLNGINHITLSVSNLDNSFKFYQDALGFKPMVKWSSGAYLLSENVWIAIIQEENTRKSALPEYTHIAFDINESEFPKAVERLKSLNVDVFQDNKSEGLSFYFLDPDGHKLEIHSGDIFSRIETLKNCTKDEYIFY